MEMTYENSAEAMPELHAGWNAELGMFLTEVEYHEELTFDGDIPAYGDASILFSFVGDPLKRIIRGYAQWPTEIKKGKAWAEVNENVWLDVGAGHNSHVQPTDEPTVLLRGTQTPSSSESIVRVVRGPSDSPSRDYEVCVDGIDAIWTLSCYPDMPRYPVGTHLKISGDPEIWMPQPVDLTQQTGNIMSKKMPVLIDMSYCGVKSIYTA